MKHEHLQNMGSMTNLYNVYAEIAADVSYNFGLLPPTHLSLRLFNKNHFFIWYNSTWCYIQFKFRLSNKIQVLQITR